jgi:hypothetical protein
MASSSTRFLDHIQRRATVGRTPLNEWSARRKDLYLTTHTTDIHAPGGIGTHDRSKRAAVDLRLRPRGHWNRHENIIEDEITAFQKKSALSSTEVPVVVSQSTVCFSKTSASICQHERWLIQGCRFTNRHCRWNFKSYTEFTLCRLKNYLFYHLAFCKIYFYYPTNITV